MIVSDEMFDAIAETQSLEIYYRSQNAGQTQNDIAEYLIGEDYFMNNKDENVREMSNFLTLISVFMYGFIIVTTLIGITSVFNTVTSNMELRKPEFAMLKSVGMTSKEFDRMIGLESLFISAKSLFIGVPIGVILSYMIHHVLSDEFKVSYRLPTAAIVISIAAVLLLASFLMRYSVNKISKQNTIETIRNENI